MVGTGRACAESAKPLAYSLLAEIVHHVRVDLSLSQVQHLSFFLVLFSSRIFVSFVKAATVTAPLKLLELEMLGFFLKKLEMLALMP